MKAQNTKLQFGKSSIVELNESTMLSIDGGTTPLCIAAGVSSGACAIAAGAAVGAAAYAVWDWLN